MATEGYKKKDIQRKRQLVQTGATISSIELDGTSTADRIELGFSAERFSVVTTGDLVADVTPLLGGVAVDTATSASTTPASDTPAHLFSALSISRTSGAGKVLIAVK